jgi:hypothetical protein
LIPSVCFRGNLKPRTGYGTIPENLGRVLESWGCRVTYDDYACGWHTHQYTEYVARRMNGFAPAACVIHCAPPDIPFDDTEPTICLTMWESSDLPAKALPSLNRARAVAVASRWNAGGAQWITQADGAKPFMRRATYSVYWCVCQPQA